VRTHNWLNAFGKLRCGTERHAAVVVDFFLFLAASVVVIQMHVGSETDALSEREILSGPGETTAEMDAPWVANA
jgi:hypothetical protein